MSHRLLPHGLPPPLRASRQTGFSLIEMMIVVIIIGILAVSALTWGVEYTANSRVRKTGESLQAVLALARNEAIKSNRNVSVVLAGLNWQVQTTDPINPILRAGSFTDTPNSPSPNVALGTADMTIIFNGLGTVITGPQDFAVSDPSATCQQLGGKIRCLRVRLTAVGQTTMCDPKLSFPADPRGCTP